MENNDSVDQALRSEQEEESSSTNATTDSPVPTKERKGKGKGKTPTNTNNYTQRPKRHPKKVANALAGIKKGSAKRIARRAGVGRFKADYFTEFNNLLHSKLKDIIYGCVAYVELDRRKTIQVNDALLTFKAQGRPVYGYEEKKKTSQRRIVRKKRTESSVADEPSSNIIEGI